MFLTAVLLVCPGIRLCVFSTGKRASSGLMLEIMDRINAIPGAADRIVRQNQEQLFLSQTSAIGANTAKRKQMLTEAGTSRLYSFPAGTASQYTTQTLYTLSNRCDRTYLR